MAALLNSLYFAFTDSFLPKYRVNYYDYIVKWAVGYNGIGVYRWILRVFCLAGNIAKKTCGHFYRRVLHFLQENARSAFLS